MDAEGVTNLLHVSLKRRMIMLLGKCLYLEEVILGLFPVCLDSFALLPGPVIFQCSELRKFESN